MKIYDSANYPVLAAAVGAIVTLTAQAQGTPVADKAISQTGGHVSISNATLEFSGKRLTGGTSVLTLAGLVNGDTVTIGSKTYTAGTEFSGAGSDSADATALAAAINAPIMEAQSGWVFNYENLNIEAKVTGTGAVSASVDIEHSINGVDWTLLVNLAPSGTTSVVVASTQSKPKPFIRVKPNSLTGTGARLQVSVAAAPV